MASSAAKLRSATGAVRRVHQPPGSCATSSRVPQWDLSGNGCPASGLQYFFSRSQKSGPQKPASPKQSEKVNLGGIEIMNYDEICLYYWSPWNMNFSIFVGKITIEKGGNATPLTPNRCEKRIEARGRSRGSVCRKSILYLRAIGDHHAG